MKKLLLALFLILIMATSAFAVGTVTITASTASVLNQKSRKIITLTWTADSSDHTVPSTTINAVTYEIEGWYLYSGETNPGGTAPTDNYDIVINDADTVDIAGGMLMNRDTSNSEIAAIGLGSGQYPMVRGNLTFVLTNNLVNSATGTCILTFIAD
jgi:hypothetical protein